MKHQKNDFILIVFLIFFFGNKLGFAQDNELGEGFFSPKTDEIEALYLYDIPNSRAGSQEKPIDSITFHKRDNWAYGISHAPKEFNPFNEKLDYGLFIIRVKKLGVDYSEIIINEETGKTAYVSSWQGNFMTWGSFFSIAIRWNL